MQGSRNLLHFFFLILLIQYYLDDYSQPVYYDTLYNNSGRDGQLLPVELKTLLVYDY